MKGMSFALLAAGVVSGCDEGSRTEATYAVVTKATHECANEPNALVNFTDATLNMTGTCERIVVKGANNKIRIEAAKRIDVDGAKNIIQIDAADTIRVNGVGNTVTYRKRPVAAKVQDVVTTGDNNTLTQTD